MNRYMKPLTSDIHLYTAQMDRTPIVISGVIDGITEGNVKVKGEHYMRGVCEFKYAG